MRLAVCDHLLVWAVTIIPCFRITPTEVNSRQSSCLTNFLLSGRSVMLEMQRRASNTKTICHMLTSHGGEIIMRMI